tara:strand:+ start:159 stop:1022 length:864 start_codon:yes stop_codon:yes gene_type:complete
MKRDFSKISFASKRAQILNECKKTKKDYAGVTLKVEQTEEPEEDFPTDVERFDQVDIDFAIYKKKNGESVPRVIRMGDTKKKNLTFWLPPMQVKWANLGPLGNIKFSKEVSKAKFTVSLLADAPNELKDLKDKFEADAVKAMELVSQICDKSMSLAHRDEDTWKKLTENYDDSLSFINDARHSVLKRDGDDVPFLNLTRRLEGWRGEPNRPTFWRLKEDNTYETIDPKFIPKGSMLSVQVSFRAYKIPSSGMYGMAGDLGDHILVVHKPAKKEKKNTLFDIPYIAFD